MTYDTPMLRDVSKAETCMFGRRLVSLSLGDRVRFTNARWDYYVEGTVVDKTDEPDGEQYYEALVETDDIDQYRIHANWRDIMPDADDQTTPYTGALEAGLMDTAPPITDLEVVTGEERHEPETNMHYAVGLDHLVWIEAESPDDALEQASKRFIEALEADDPLEFSVLDREER